MLWVLRGHGGNLVVRSRNGRARRRPVVGKYAEDEPLSVSCRDVTRERSRRGYRAGLRANVSFSWSSFHPVLEGAVNSGDGHRIVKHRERRILLTLVEHFHQRLGRQQIVSRQATAIANNEPIRLHAPGE